MKIKIVRAAKVVIQMRSKCWRSRQLPPLQMLRQQRHTSVLPSCAEYAELQSIFLAFSSWASTIWF